ncbi:MAG: hypothetical protein FWC47_16350 [Oscillospiraceae bacterium]|nr:hypothetical protein [Oscillospiraceae bacterium]
MNLVFTLKMLSDICFYFTFANFFSYLFTGNNVLIAVPIMVISAFLSAILKSRGFIKYLPLVLMVSCFFVIPINLVNIIVLLPPIFYIAYNVYKIKKFKYDFVYSDVFFLYLKIAGPFMLIILFYLYENFMENSLPYSLPYVLIFLVSSVILMRMLKQDESVLKQVKFKILTILPVILTLGAGLIFASKTSFQVLKAVFSFIYFNILIPVLMLIFTGVSYLGLLLYYFLKSISRGELELPMNVDNSAEEINSTQQYLNQNINYNGAGFQVFKMVFMVIFICFLIFFAYKLFKKFMMRDRGYMVHDDVMEERIPIVKDEESFSKNKSRKLNQVRLIYKKFLLLCIKFGIPINKSFTSLDYEKLSKDKFKKDEVIDGIRSIYLEVRYGEKEASREDVKKIKELFEDLKK